MAIVLFIIGAVFLLLAYLIGVKRMSGLIAGVNTASEEEKSRLNLPAITRATGICMGALGALSALAGALSLAGVPYTIEGWMFLLLLGVWFLVIFVQKYDSAMVDADGRPTKRFYIFSAVISLLMIAVLAFVGSLALSTTRDPAVSFSADAMTIGGMYGTTVSREEIQDVSLLYALPELENKTNGSGIFGAYKGGFRVSGIGAALVYVREDSTPWILLRREKKPILLCLSTPENTLALYGRIGGWLKGNGE